MTGTHDRFASFHAARKHDGQSNHPCHAGQDELIVAHLEQESLDQFPMRPRSGLIPHVKQL
jgi:hypothetical protein